MSHTTVSVEEFDANLDTFIQLNSSKVPAQQGVYSLVISTGGTGLDTLLETKGLINKTCCLNKDHKNLPTDHVRYLAFDTDMSSLTRVSSKQTGGAKLDEGEGEFVQMDAPNIGAFLSRAYRNQVPSYISSWLDFSINPTHTGTAGAGGIRQCGRLLLFQNIERVRKAIDSAIREMIADHDVVTLNVYLLAGIAGGTGSGTFLDLAYIARDVAEGIAPTKVTTYGYLLLPDVNLSRSMPEDHAKYSMKNGYAALKELDYLMNAHKDGGKFMQRYSPNYVIDTDRAPFSYVHLVSSTGFDGRVLSDPYRGCMRAVAQSIVSFVAEEKKEGVAGEFAIKSHYDNINHGVAQHHSTFPERDNCYVALGTYSYELPVDKLLLYVTSLLFRKMNKMFDRDPTAPEIDAAYRALGLTPNSLLAVLVGDEPKIVPDNTRWEHLFGRNPMYNVVGLCNQWVTNITPAIQARAKQFLKDFPDQFTQMTGAWFVDPEKGPIWVNHLIVNNTDNCVGLVARLGNDFAAAGLQITNTRTEAKKLQGELNATAEDAGSAPPIVGGREEKTRRYIELINRYAKQRAMIEALTAMQDIYESCLKIIGDTNDAIFSVIVNILEALKDICQKNADILTHTEMNETATGAEFKWQPINIPAVSVDIERIFDSKGDTNDTITRFSKAIYKKAYEWASGNIDVKAFIRDYLDTNLSDIANRSLEDYVKVMLRGEDLEQSVINKLGPDAIGQSVPLISLTKNADVGGKFWLLSVPYSCTEILGALKKYKATTPDMASTLTIQPSGINSRIFAQSLLSAVPLAAYSKLAEYEQIYLNQYGNTGRHLYMGEKENWEYLPSPIPYRSRPKMEGAYPAAVKAVEDEQRKLFRKCFDLPIIRRSDGATGTDYDLYCSKLPDIDEEFAKEKLLDEKGRLDPQRVKDAIEKLEEWLKTGLPNRDLSDDVHEVSYHITTCAIPKEDEGERDERDIVARECFLGQYNNMRRAREELEKYQKVQSKLDELNSIFQKSAGVLRRVLQTIQLLVSGVVKLARSKESYEFYYVCVLKDRESRLVDVGEREGWREAVMIDAMEALAEHKDSMKREMYAGLIKAAETEYRKMDADSRDPHLLENAREKLKRLSSLHDAVQGRCDQLRYDIMEERQAEGVDRETLAFYERLVNQLEREKNQTEKRIRDIENPIDDGDIIY